MVAVFETYSTTLDDNQIASETAQVGDVWSGTLFTPPALDVIKYRMGRAIDAAVMAIYDRPATLGDEYKAREADAIAYKAAGYTGTVPARVDGFATPAGMTAKAATDLILGQAAQLRGALAQLSDLRMQKYAVNRAATEAAALAVYNSAMATIAGIAAALG